MKEQTQRHTGSGANVDAGAAAATVFKDVHALRFKLFSGPIITLSPKVVQRKRGLLQCVAAQRRRIVAQRVAPQHRVNRRSHRIGADRRAGGGVGGGAAVCRHCVQHTGDDVAREELEREQRTARRTRTWINLRADHTHAAQKARVRQLERVWQRLERFQVWERQRHRFFLWWLIFERFQSLEEKKRKKTMSAAAAVQLDDDELRAPDAALADAQLARPLLSRFRSSALARITLCDLVGLFSSLSLNLSLLKLFLLFFCIFLLNLFILFLLISWFQNQSLWIFSSSLFMEFWLLLPFVFV